MAKADEINGLSCNMVAAHGAAIILRARFEEMSALSAAALDFSSIDGIHDMRVGMRRMRNAMRDLRHVLKKDHYKRFNKQLKKMYDRVGAVRDEDVAIYSLGKMRAKTDSEIVRQGIDNLIHAHHETREAARDKLRDILTADLFAELESDLTALLQAVKEGTHTERTFKDVGQESVERILKKFCKLSDNLYTAYDFEALHKFRIASKRLRTALELFGICWVDEAAPFIEEVARMQLILGRVHDRDAWLTDLTARLNHENKKVLIVDGLAAKWIAAKLVKKRNKNYNVALQLWKEWEAKDLIGKLRETIAQE